MRALAIIIVLAVPATVGAAPAEPILSTVAAEAAFSENGTRWFGPAMSVCLRSDWACWGLMARFAYADELWSSGDLLAAIRLSSEMLVSASTDFYAGPVSITPSLGVGIGWFRENPTEIAIDVDASGETMSIRSEARVMASLPVSEFAAVSLVLGVGVSPLTWTISERREMQDEMGAVAEPTWMFRSAIAVSFGL